ncbi:MAG: ABC transporter permease [Oscillospiraceae bacterium]|nr:ABC transporter permease [Oscillospiraceae bacterium]
MRAALANEISKLLNHKKYIVFMALGVLFSVFWSFLGNMIVKGLALLGGASLFMELGFTPTSSLPLFACVLLPLLIFMGCADLFTAEFADHTIRACLIRPCHRVKLYAAKALAVLAYIAAYLAVILAVGEITGLISGAVNTPGKFFAAIGSYALTLAPLAVMTAFAALVSLVLGSGTLVMFLLILSLLVFAALPILLPFLNGLLFTDYLTWYRLWIGAVPPPGKMVNVTLILIGYGAAFTLGGMIVFERRDV